MNSYSFFAGVGVGILLLTIVVFVFVVLNRRMTKEQREANERSNLLMEEGNRLREQRAQAMWRIAHALEILAEKKP